MSKQERNADCSLCMSLSLSPQESQTAIHSPHVVPRSYSPHFSSPPQAPSAAIDSSSAMNCPSLTDELSEALAQRNEQRREECDRLSCQLTSILAEGGGSEKFRGSKSCPTSKRLEQRQRMERGGRAPHSRAAVVRWRSEECNPVLAQKGKRRENDLKKRTGGEALQHSQRRLFNPCTATGGIEIFAASE